MNQSLILKMVCLVASIVCLCSCGPSPRDVAEDFSKAISNGKIEEAKKYCTEPTGKLLDLTSKFAGANIDPDFKFYFEKDSIADKRAWVYFYSNDKKKKLKKLELVNLEGKWLVNMDKRK